MLHSNQDTMQQVGMDQVLEAVHNGEDIIVYYGQEDCGECREFSKIIDKIMLEKNVDVCYLDADKMGADDKEKFMQFEITMTPALIIVTKGKAYIYRNLDNKKDIEMAVTHINIEEERFDELKKIDYEGLNRKTETNIDFFLYIGREDCRDCQKFYPIVEQ